MAQDDVVRTLEWALLEAHLPGCDPLPAGILVVDPDTDELHLRLLPKLSGADDDAAKFWHELAQDLIERSQAVGGCQMLNWLETTASHLIQLGSRDFIEALNPQKALDLLYRRYVAGDPKIEPPQSLHRSAAH